MIENHVMLWQCFLVHTHSVFSFFLWFSLRALQSQSECVHYIWKCIRTRLIWTVRCTNHCLCHNWNNQHCCSLAKSSQNHFRYLPSVIQCRACICKWQKAMNFTDVQIKWEMTTSSQQQKNEQCIWLILCTCSFWA